MPSNNNLLDNPDSSSVAWTTGSEAISPKPPRYFHFLLIGMFWSFRHSGPFTEPQIVRVVDGCFSIFNFP